jgi:hypothetical protein
MSNQPHIDYRFKFAAVNCARIVPQLRGLPNMLGEPLDAYGQPLFNPDYEPSFMAHGSARTSTSRFVQSVCSVAPQN